MVSERVLSPDPFAGPITMPAHRSAAVLPGLASLLLVWGCLVGGARGDQASPADPPRYQRGVLIRFQGMITPMLEQFVKRQLEVARQQQADLVIVEIESPGGLVDPSFNIAHTLRDVDWAHVVAFIPREALSGAAVVAMGCDEIFMHPDARMGDVGVITMGEDSLFRYAEEKVRTNIAHQLRDLAEAKGRPPALAEAMVNMDLVVYHVTNRQTGEQTFRSEEELRSADDPDVWQQGKPVFESREKYFLQVNGRRAEELQLSDGTARDVDELKRQLGLDGELQVLKPTAVDTAVFILNLPLITALLFVVGLIALYIELSAPGISIGGLIAMLCFTLFFWSRFLGGTAEMLEVLLFLAGVLFLAVEIFILPGFGVAGISGLLLMVISVVMASHHFVVPETPRQLAALATTLLVVAGSGVTVLIVATVLSRYFGMLPVLNRLVLQPEGAAGGPAEISAGHLKPQPGQMAGIGVGELGIAQSPLRPSGKARFGDELLDVMTDGDFVDRGHQVRIVEVQGSRILVAEVESS
jgi:membrane-bound serine protease (ClpP class)